MKSFIVIVFLISVISSMKMAEKCTFRILYKDFQERFVVSQALEALFRNRFEAVVKQASRHSPYLVNPAYYFEIPIKEKYINEGVSLKTLEDLEILLKAFNYTKYENFGEEKLKYNGRKNG